ncbi:hypothetical protein BC943DRAFT_362034 [Umbelopsis sp. AD052]|nr:hypothetical protein BC943DRAFT_362034 [Umbelopsis sp. AD052]
MSVTLYQVDEISSNFIYPNGWNGGRSGKRLIQKVPMHLSSEDPHVQLGSKLWSYIAMVVVINSILAYFSGSDQ